MIGPMGTATPRGGGTSLVAPPRTFVANCSRIRLKTSVASKNSTLELCSSRQSIAVKSRPTAGAAIGHEIGRRELVWARKVGSSIGAEQNTAVHCVQPAAQRPDQVE